MTEINFFQFHKKYGVVYLYYEENFKMLCACINQYGNKQNTKRIFKNYWIGKFFWPHLTLAMHAWQRVSHTYVSKDVCTTKG